MTDLLIDAPADAAAREAALDIRRSVIVQAPAGSGKTDLLTRRYLRLLAAVDEPEEILAITFTRAATAEMRSRILADLESAAKHLPFSPDELPRMAAARAALAHAERRGWKILEQPQRLAVETIDSLCLRIAHDRPLLARLGGHFQPVDDASSLYALAARRTLEHLGSPNAALDQALAQLLDLRDNRLSDCESLLAKMLEVRDQWQNAFPLSRAMSEDDWDQLRVHLEAPFHRENRRALAEAHFLLSAQPAIVRQLLELANYARSQGNEAVALLTGLETLSPAMPLEHWNSVCDFLLTGDNEWRKSVNVRQGFPATGREAKQRKAAMQDLLQWLQHTPQLHAALCAIRKLPPAAYTPAQWTTLRNVFTALRQAIAELKVVFAEHNKVDFTELTLAALDVLRHSPERVADITGNIRHLLIDEFQDTSRRQHELVSALLAAWNESSGESSGEGSEDGSDSTPSHQRTVFLVGDPMQSIYMFRQAEVELFTQVRDHGIAPLDLAHPGPETNRIRCHPVQLSVNFRSHAGLTGPLNSIFRAICSDDPPPGAAAVRFAEATSSSPAPPYASLHIHPQLIGSADRRPTLADFANAQQQEALDVLHILERQLPLIEQARATNAEYRVAVLVRARSHLAQLIPLLRDKKIPFRAVEIEHLSERQELLDLLALTHALLHPMDRIAWLSVLRAPWCGLTLSDLHRLTGSDDPAFKDLSVLELIDRHRHLLSADGQHRLARTAAILRRALDLRWRQSESPSFSSWIERTWRTLGGPATVDAAAYENTQVFFSLLDAVTPSGLAPSTTTFDAEFNRLFAQPDPAVSERCGIQLMTIHKAKGLGFEVVIVPGLDRQSSIDANPLVCSLERINLWVSNSASNSGSNSASASASESAFNAPGETEFLVAPIGLQGEDTEPLYRWVRRQRQLRFDEERKRLFYVACTRARRELHLLGTAVASASGIRPDRKDSLLQTAWPALSAEFESLQRAPQISAPAASRVLTFPGVLKEVAAVAEPRLTLRRLPLDAEPLTPAQNVTVTASISLTQPGAPEFPRREGSRQARLIGSAVHTLLERLGPELETHATAPAQLRARAASLLRAAALTGDSLKSATDTVTNLLLACAADPVCRWILSPHEEAQSEASWSGFTSGLAAGDRRLRTLRADRVFRAGPTPGPVPLHEGSDYLWVIDYKTGAAPSGALFLQAERALYAPQLLAYASALRALHGPETQLRLGLYYPVIAAFDYWDPDRA
jgi:ATP-dependent exoDNAse (exonuclease V) beta subunit